MSSGDRNTTDRRRDPDLVGAEAAMQRAARRARERARTSGVRPSADSRDLTFSQAQGYEEVPRPLKLKELPGEMRTQIWNLFYAHLNESKVDPDPNVIPLQGIAWVVVGDWEEIFRAKHIFHDHLPLDEWSVKLRVICPHLRNDIETLPFNKVFDLIQFVLRHPKCPPVFVAEMKRIFELCRLAYGIDEGNPPTIVPSVTDEEASTVIESLETLRGASLGGSAEHLRKACECINQGDWAGSIRESIHTVESVARKLSPEATTLKPALASINDHAGLHPALRDGLIKLYGYTSDDPGLRHPLLDSEKAKVGIDEAVFMLGACASLASYLWRKHNAGEVS